MAELIDKVLLKTFVPPSALNSENFQELAGKSFIEEIAAGRMIFKEGDTDNKTIYLVDGEAVLSNDSGEATSVTAGTQAGMHPLANFQPRRHTAVAKTVCKITRIDSDLLDILMTWDQMSAIEVDEIHTDDDEEEGDDWMTRILQSKAFLQVPPGNIQAMFMRIESVNYKPGDKVIEQDQDGDYFYIIKEGRCMVTRATPANPKGVKLATLSVGDSFGEEALISDA
ncbi:MAG: cyclic nucleotide-binding domain-containing protein, partial [Gammaproteobacteria bacterium]|nr:cyclic nucleotide-binding domain-containing protein [Gammaproteobacteria bacterium]